MTVCLVLLSAVALTAAVPAPRALTRAAWPEREPVTALWAWQCLVSTALLCCLSALALGAAAVVRTVRDHVFAPAPPAVAAAHGLSAASTAPAWTTALTVVLAAGAAWTAAVLARELTGARRRRGAAHALLRERAPELPIGLPSARGPMLVLEDAYPRAWWLPGRPARLVVTTGALRRLTDHQLNAVLAHEGGHARAHHDWLLHLSTALATGFPRVALFTRFCDQTHRLVELAADDTASRRCGRLTTALALVELNQHRGVLSGNGHRLLDERVNRLLQPPRRLARPRRGLIAAVAALIPFVPLLITFLPGLTTIP
ncbi:M56 family metallopeptidase [Streptomyces sp. x-19]|uniref:M56 family metallopeptidase n=1 Tax=Streptomyces sp. x-19 TaxID=2789280 RepID=UPI003980CB2C